MIRKWILTVFAFLAMKHMTSVSGITKLEFFLTNPLDSELYYNTMEFICSEGYPVQQHKVVTEDGYVITLHRIPNGNRRERVTGRGLNRYHLYVQPAFYQCVNDSLSEKPTGPPVVIQHGFLGASDNWVLQGQGKDLAYLLADAGYDVWLSNVRGNFYSRSHLYRSTKSKEFWDFSFHELAEYDIPAVIDYVLKETNQNQVYYAGHSMGTTALFILGTVRPEYMQKIRLANLLAPVANLTDALGMNRRGLIPKFLERSVNDMKSRGNYELLPRVNWVPLIINRFCNQKSYFQDLCYDIGISVDGHPYYNLGRRTFARTLSHLLSGSSAKTLEHFLQLFRSKRFRPFDYGPEENFRRYHQATPPDYDLSRVTCPVALFYSNADLFIDSSQVNLIERQLPNVVYSKEITEFLHTDFTIGRNAKEKVTLFDGLTLTVLNQIRREKTRKIMLMEGWKGRGKKRPQERFSSVSTSQQESLAASDMYSSDGFQYRARNNKTGNDASPPSRITLRGYVFSAVCHICVMVKDGIGMSSAESSAYEGGQDHTSAETHLGVGEGEISRLKPHKSGDSWEASLRGDHLLRIGSKAENLLLTVFVIALPQESQPFRLVAYVTGASSIPGPTPQKRITHNDLLLLNIKSTEHNGHGLIMAKWFFMLLTHQKPENGFSLRIPHGAYLRLDFAGKGSSLGFEAFDRTGKIRRAYELGCFAAAKPYTTGNQFLKPLN